jgi:hypothetical protein
VSVGWRIVHRPRLNITKRTKQLRDAETLILKSDGTESGTIHTTQGQYEMQPGDNEELSANLRASRHAAAITRIAEAVYKQAAEFFEATVLSVAKVRAPFIFDAYLQGDQANLEAWMKKMGFALEQDGLKSIVKMGEKVLADVEAEVEPGWRDDVENFIKSSQAILRAGEGRAA